MIRIENEYEKFGLIMRMHFPDVVPGRVEDLNCQMCQDLKRGDCAGKNLMGDDVIGCMEEKLHNVIIEIHSPIMH